jgi:hypothetical protein
MFSRRGQLAAGVVLLAVAVANWSVWRATAVVKPPPQSPRQGGGLVPESMLVQAGSAVVNFADLAREELARARSAAAQPEIGITLPDDEYEEPPMLEGEFATGPNDAVGSADVPSPSPSHSFQGLDDITILGTGTSIIPPDTDGAVGPTRIFNTLNNNYRILDKTNGATISTVSMSSFWAATGAAGPFDPRTLYDPYQNRFVVAAVSNAQSASSSLLIGVSTTSDPAGSWILVRYLLGSTPCAGNVNCWADYPTLGFNQTWIAVSVNMFSTSSGFFQESRVSVMNYATLAGGAAPVDHVFVTGDFTVHPVQTFSSAEPTLYAPVHVSSAGRSYRLNSITGTPDGPVYTQGGLTTHTLIGSWSVVPGAPQAPNPADGTMQTIDAGDSRIVNAVFRNNAIWYAQSVGLPAGAPAHSAAQWVKLGTSGNDLDAGRVEDPSATS